MPCVKNQAIVLPSACFETNEKLPLKSLKSNGDIGVGRVNLHRTNEIIIIKETKSELHILNKQENTNLNFRRLTTA
jgi:hypothetical protein